MDKEEIFTIMDRLLEPSTIKGIVALIGAVLIFFLKPEEANNWATNISNLLFALYGVYQIFRNESAQLVKVAEKMEKKLALLAIVFLFTIPMVVNAAEVCVEPLIAEGSYTLEIDAVELEITTWNSYTDADGTWHCFDVIDGLSSGAHTFRVKAVDTSGWDGEWSLPFDAYRPGQSNNWKIRK